MAVDFIVKRDEPRQSRFVSAPDVGELASGQVELKVDRFALTANNISYAVAGDMLGYWHFFQAEAGWGRIPAMGFGEVLRSKSAGIEEGERFFGFYPMSHSLVVQADSVGPGSFLDAAPHRSETAPVYRQYSRASGDPLYAADREDQLMLMRGLFMTSFLVDDFLAENGFFGAKSFLISSASSKTSIALAYQLSQRGAGPVVGFTSPRNLGFVKSLKCYDQVLPYDEIASLSPDTPVAFVDMAGNGSVVTNLHRHFGDNMKHSCSVGLTHWEQGGRDENLPGAKPEFFFAPAQIQKRTQDWGAAGVQERIGGAWRKFDAYSDEWLRILRGRGEQVLERVYNDTLEGRTRPDEGHVLSLWSE